MINPRYHMPAQSVCRLPCRWRSRKIEHLVYRLNSALPIERLPNASACSNLDIEIPTMTYSRPNNFLRLLIGIALAALAFSPVAGQTTSVANPTADQQESTPTDFRTEVIAQQGRIKGELESARATLIAAEAGGEAAPTELTDTIALLTKLDLLYGQVLAALDHQNELNSLKTRLSSDLEKLRSIGPPETRPFRFGLLESLRDQLETETSRDQSRTDAVEAAKDSLAGARTVFGEKERARRQAKESLDASKDAPEQPKLAAALQHAQLESRVADVEVKLREVEFANQKLERDVQNVQLTLLREKIDQVAKDVRFTQKGLDEVLAQLDQAEFRSTQALEFAQADFSIRDAEWVDARRRLEASPVKEQALIEEFEARALARRSRQRAVSLIGEQLQAYADSRKAWNRRYQVFNGLTDDATARKWEAETKQILDQLDRDLRINSARIAELRPDAEALESKLKASTDAGPEVKRWVEQQKQHFDSMLRTYEETITILEAARKLHTKLLSEIAAQVATVTWTEWLDNVWRTILEIWNYEITSVQDSPITVRKIVIGIALLFIGLFASRRLVNWIARRFLPRFGLNEGAVAAIQSILFYLLLLTVVMISLRIVSVPLTAFTILGGALAIGIGFGSQNIVNNFISGLILLAERPIRVGDLVELDDLVGIVEHIGPRSTRVRSPENVDIIVPNSFFLEKNVINWTLTDDRYRAKISVGVVYGSPTRQVMTLIRQALDEHRKVLTKPEPVILFEEFGDNALIFEAHFWVRMRRIMDRRIIQSELRCHIDSLFRQAGIVVAFPQRDVHLDAPDPIAVRLVDVEASKSPGPRAVPSDTDKPGGHA